MQLKDMLETIARSGLLRFEIFTRNAESVLSSEATVQNAIWFGLHELIESDIAYLAVVDTEEQPETLQIYLN